MRTSRVLALCLAAASLPGSTLSPFAPVEAAAESPPEAYTGAVRCEDAEVKAALVQFLGTGAGVPAGTRTYASLSDAKRPWKAGGGPYRLDVPTSAFFRTLTSFPSSQRGDLAVALTQNHGSAGAVALVNVAFCQFHRKKTLSDWGKVGFDDAFLTGSKYFKYPKGGTGKYTLQLPDTTRADVGDSRVVVAVFDVGGITDAKTFSFNFELGK